MSVSGGLDDLEGRAARLHPAAAVASVAGAGYALASAVFIGLGIVLVHIVGLKLWDEDVNEWFAADRTRPTNGWTKLLTMVADTSGIVVVLAVAIVVLVLVRWRWDALFMAIALALELSTFLTINLIVDRPRPDVNRLGALPSTSSFPSGHTAATIAFYGGLALVVGQRSRVAGGALWVFALALATAVGFARVYRGFHHPSDVAAGALLGLCVLAVARRAVQAGKRAAAARRLRRTDGTVQRSADEEVLR
jgi:membrane-associated phospholipid phosphatase